MAHKLQVPYPGTIHQVMNRGDRREAIFSAEFAEPFRSPPNVPTAACTATSSLFSSKRN